MARVAIEAVIVPTSIIDGQVNPVGQFIVSQPGTLTADNLYLEFDPAMVPDTQTLVHVLQSTIAFLVSQGSITQD